MHMAIDESPGALPRLVGAPAYARPAAPVAAPRPFDPDELPLEIDQTEEERAFAARLPARAFAPGGADVRVAEGSRTTREAGDETSSAPQPARSKGLRGITRVLNRL
jgi:hypothetical protein